MARLPELPASRLTLIRAAVAQAKAPLPATGGGYTVIKSVSPKQRPRRKMDGPQLVRAPLSKGDTARIEECFRARV
jgi:hypothetical protein